MNILLERLRVMHLFVFQGMSLEKGGDRGVH